MRSLIRYTTLFSVSLLLAVTALAQSRSVFVPHSITTNAAYELALSAYQRTYNHTIDESFYSFTIDPFYQSTTKGCDFARYFTPNCRPCISLQENGSGDVNPIWFSGISSLDTFYSSTVCFSPKRQAYGATVNFYAYLGKCVEGLWTSINFTPMGVRHNMHVKEYGLVNEGTLPGLQDACELLTYSTHKYGKISCCAQSKGGVDDIQLKLGYDLYHCNENSRLGIYAAGVIPTGSKPKAKYLFEPVIGSKHGAFGGGVYGDYRWSWEDCHGRNNAAAILMDFKYLYAFQAKQLRTFDLNATGTNATSCNSSCNSNCSQCASSLSCGNSSCGASSGCSDVCSVSSNNCSTGCSVSSNNCSTGCSFSSACSSDCDNLSVRDWSRYLLLITSTAPFNPTNNPAVNFVTQCAQVTPRGLIEFWTAVHYEMCKWQFEVGYNLWWRQSEKVKCVGKIPSGYGIFNMSGVGSPNPFTASTATISESVGGGNLPTVNPVVGDGEFIELTNADLNYRSGTAPSQLSNKIYGSIGRQCCEHFLYGINGSYEFGGRNHTPSQWALWLTLSAQW